MNYKKILGSGMLTAMMLSALAPAGFVFAEGKQKNESQSENGKQFCDRVSNIEINLNEKESKTLTRIDTRKAERGLSMKNRWGAVDSNRSDRRARLEAKKAEKITKLGDKATTDAQKAAIAVFKTSIDTAIETRKNAVDTAVKNYRDTVSKALGDSKNELESFIKGYKDTMSVALAKAKTDCANGIDSKVVANNFTQTKKDAQAVLKKNREDKTGMSDIVKAAAETRKQAIDKTQTDFKNSMENAKTILKTAMNA